MHTAMPTVTRVEVLAEPTGVCCRLVQGALSPRRLRSAETQGSVRVALVAASALLLAGDEVRVEVVVDGPVTLEVVEVAGMVAYDMRGGSATWDVDVTLRHGARLTWGGEPFVLSGGADVDRSFTLSLETGSRAAVRESLVLGRSDEVGGELRTRTRAFLAGGPLLVEDLDLGIAARGGWAVLGVARCLETVTTYGVRLPEALGVLQSDGPCSTVRTLGDRFHLSRSETAWTQACRAVLSGSVLEPAPAELPA